MACYPRASARLARAARTRATGDVPPPVRAEGLASLTTARWPFRFAPLIEKRPGWGESLRPIDRPALGSCRRVTATHEPAILTVARRGAIVAKSRGASARV